MAKKQISRRKRKRKTRVTTHVPVCALGKVIEEKQVFAPIYNRVRIDQKAIDYRPTDKLIFATLGIIAGAETINDVNIVLRPNRALLAAFGYTACADQSVIQQTINVATSANVSQLECAILEIWQLNNRIGLLTPNETQKQPVTIDIDLSPLPISKHAQGSLKGYVAKRKNLYTRQMARVLVPQTQEIVTQSLYSGNTLSCSVFKEMIAKMEPILQLDTKAKRQQICLRLDAGFGTTQNINFVLWRGYQLLVKMYSGNRAKKLAKSVKQWVAVKSGADNTPREAGWVTAPHRYGKKTVQVAVRTPKKKGGYSYSVLVTTHFQMSLRQIVTDYDGRSGVPESTFCQDYQGLCMRKQKKKRFVGQQILMLLSQLPHNLCVWTKSWLIDALQNSLLSGEQAPKHQEARQIAAVIATIESRGIKRFLRQVLHLSGKVVFFDKKVVAIVLNPLYPLIDRIKKAFEIFLAPYEITVSLAKT